MCLRNSVIKLEPSRNYTNYDKGVEMANKKLFWIFAGVLTFIVFLVVADTSSACTDFQIKAKDGAIIIGRSMEFAMKVESEIIVHPREEELSSQTPAGKNGLSWKSKYGFVSVNAFGIEDATVDGINEAGLSVEFLWLPGTEYQNIPEGKDSKALTIGDLGNWILGSFATVDEVKRAIEEVYVCSMEIPQMNMVVPLHLAVHDAEGKNVVIEFVGGERKVYDNPIGVMTNAPTFDWHLTNLRNYVNITSNNVDSVTIEGVTLNPTGQGSGLLGIPGDWTPPSRFIRAVAFVHFADPVENASLGVNLAEHILNTVDIPAGAIKGKELEFVKEDYTQWVVIKDLTNKVLYFRSYENLCLRSVDLKKISFAPGTKSKSVPISGKRNVIDVTDMLQ